MFSDREAELFSYLFLFLNPAEVLFASVALKWKPSAYLYSRYIRLQKIEMFFFYSILDLVGFFYCTFVCLADITSARYFTTGTSNYISWRMKGASLLT